jgi:hypothetical protein
MQQILRLLTVICIFFFPHTGLGVTYNLLTANAMCFAYEASINKSLSDIDCYDETGGTKFFTNAPAKIFRFVRRSSSSTFLNPKIEVCYKVCTAGDTTVSDCKTLSAWGECRSIAATRFCARPAAPGRNGNQTNIYPGCNFKADDPRYLSPNPRVQVCAYEDPWAGNAADPSDYNKRKMLYHYNTRYSETTDLVKALADLGIDSTKLFLSESSKNNIGTTLAEMLNRFSGEALTKINLIVVDGDDAIGCVDLPIGPYPPPFCPTLGNGQPYPLGQRICEPNAQPTMANQCMVSVTPTTFEQPAIRVTFDDIIPRCNNNMQAGTECVNFYSDSGATSLAQNINPPVDTMAICGTGSAPCVQLPQGKTYTNNLPIRAMYTNLTNYYKSPYESNIYSLYRVSDVGIKIYGVNASPYQDLVLQYSNGSYNTPTVTIDDGRDGENNPANRQRSFMARLEYKTESLTEKEVCLYETTGGNSTKLDCVDRPSMPKPVVTPCNTPLCPPTGDCNTPIIRAVTCNSTAASPKMVVGVGNPIDYKIAIYTNNTTNTLELYGDTSLSIKKYNSVTQKQDPTNGDYICVVGYSSNERVLVKLIPDPNNSSKKIPSLRSQDRLLPRYDPANPVVVTNSYNNGDIIDYPARVPVNPTLLDVLMARYGYTDPKQVVNNLTEVVRPKTPLELGLCVPIPAS